mgnify:FL=1|jgi:hypothetical protein|tara:strand:- start:1259 stop:1462 length:204 start_codon:yes stop_codon:yes gene_type:complete
MKQDVHVVKDEEITDIDVLTANKWAGAKPFFLDNKQLLKGIPYSMYQVVRGLPVWEMITHSKPYKST